MTQTPRRVALLIVGDELLDGRTRDSNGQYFATRLREHGVSLVRTQITGDAMEDMLSSLRHLASLADFVLCSGGIGPTEDDRTRAAVAEFAGVDLIEDAASWQAILERFRRLDREPSETNRRQAWHPRGSVVLPNPVGTAPGFLATTEAGVQIAAVPGVPVEAQRMFDECVLPRLSAQAAIPQGTLLFAGVPESQFGALIEHEMREEASSRVGITANWGFLRVTVRSADEAELGSVLARIRAVGEEWFVGEGGGRIEDVLVQELAQRGERVALAESCTGGRAASRITGVSGSSAVFHESFVTYSNSAKTRILGVPEAIFESDGAVSEACVRAMVAGLAERTGAELCGAVSGIAGPNGGSDEKPVGLVHFATWHRGDLRHSVREYGNPGREIIQSRATSDLLMRLVRQVREST